MIRASAPNGVRAARGAVLTGTLLVTSLLIAVVAQLGSGAGTDRLAGYEVLWPQRWWFFTGLGENEFVAYRIEATEDLNPRDERHRRAERLFGLNRIDDVRETEVLPIGRLVPSRYWQTCGQAELIACSAGLDRSLSYRLRNPARRPTICGSTAVVARRAIAREPGVLPDKRKQVVKVALTDVECAR